MTTGTLAMQNIGILNHRALAAAIEANGGCRYIYRNVNGKPVLYLKRYYLYRGKEGEHMIHQFFLSDKGGLHDHPMASYGQILETGYFEWLCDAVVNGQPVNPHKVWRPAGFIGSRPASTATHDDYRSFHKVELKPGTEGEVWTYFATGPRTDTGWGFLEGRFIPYQEYFKLDGTESMQSSPEDFGFGFMPVKKNREVLAA